MTNTTNQLRFAVYQVLIKNLYLDFFSQVFSIKNIFSQTKTNFFFLSYGLLQPKVLELAVVAGSGSNVKLGTQHKTKGRDLSVCIEDGSGSTCSVLCRDKLSDFNNKEFAENLEQAPLYLVVGVLGLF